MKNYIGKWKVIFLCIGYDTFMIFYQLLPSLLIALVSFIFVVLLYSIFSKKVITVQALFFMMIALIPTSFVSIAGTSFAQFPFTWFMFVTIVLFLTVLYKGNLDVAYLLLFILFTLVCCLTLLNVESVGNACKQIFTILLFLCSFVIGDNLKNYYSDKFMENANFLYLVSVIGFSISVLFQKMYIDQTGNIVGHYAIMGAGRVTYAGVMEDYSFATLYIATGAILLLVSYFEEKKINFLPFILSEILFVFSILIVNSRTGLFALMLISVIYLFNKLMRGNIKALFIGLILLLSIPVFCNYLLNSRGGQDLLDSSGRVDNYIESFLVFSNHKLFGVGFGLVNLKNITGLSVPHNFFVQYLVQCGIVGTLLFTLIFMVFLMKNINKNNNTRWVVYTVLLGSMLIPDIVSSRFLTVIIIMVTIDSQRKKMKLHNSKMSNQKILTSINTQTIKVKKYEGFLY
jgi:O-Antigen ligase.